ncbi:biotin--[acetyl-CoA-carboxylase] ligase [Olivibacter sp. XZL3]|uniref:biotin--[acetyl-CoA-carboxylase] ligase n=1 Tax=Olivibacter sp. XZL3 TaxID=1735116 RepID=UPI001F0DA828|nr:biotin--[acetyl-CoA-carboxylase] ligase [Olivibacter sp. XZL3]
MGLIVGENIITLQRVSSTNDYLKSNLSNSTPYSEGTVIMAVEQYAGKGQAGNVWRSEPGKNLTCSILLNPGFLSPKDQFNLNIAVSLAIIDTLRPILGGDLRIKWPNDIYFLDKKIGGILIENILRGMTWKHAIIGLAINVNQTDFDNHHAKASSLKQLLGRDFDINELLSSLCLQLSIEYELLKHGNAEQRPRYKRDLYRLGQRANFMVGDQCKNGTVLDISREGKLVVDFDGQLTEFGIKEIAFL